MARKSIDAAKQQDIAAFRKTLTDRARDSIGTAGEMQAIQSKLSQYGQVTIGEPVLVASKKGDRGGGDIGDVKRKYKAIVTGAPAKGDPPEALYTMLLRCTLSNEVVHHDAVAESCTTTIDQNGVPWESCTGGSAAYDDLELFESCHVDRIDEEAAVGTIE